MNEWARRDRAGSIKNKLLPPQGASHYCHKQKAEGLVVQTGSYGAGKMRAGVGAGAGTGADAGAGAGAGAVQCVLERWYGLGMTQCQQSLHALAKR